MHIRNYCKERLQNLQFIIDKLYTDFVPFPTKNIILTTFRRYKYAIKANRETINDNKVDECTHPMITAGNIVHRRHISSKLITLQVHCCTSTASPSQLPALDASEGCRWLYRI